MKKISIIVPIYNAEEHLDKCVESILEQTETNLEIILVDDGSKDNSFEICKKYEKTDQRVKVIHQENAGVSVARNHGIELAEGEYIGFVDSDDWIEPVMYERLLKEAKETNADVVMCDATTVYSDGKIQADTITQLSKNQVLNKPDFTPSLLLEMAGSAWRCIYKNNRYNDKLIKSERLYFPLGVKFSEDRIFNIYAFGYADKIAYIKESYYNRYMNEKSAVHRFHEDYFEAYKKAAEEIEKAINVAWNAEEKYKTAYLQQFISGALMAICNYYYKTSTLNRKSRKNAVEKVCQDNKLREAIQKVEIVNMQTRWLLKEKRTLLILYAKLANWKHRR